VLFTTARRKHAINEGQRQFADLTECVIRQSSVTVSSSAREFDLLSTSILAGSSNAAFLRVAEQGPAYLVSDSNGNLQTIAGDDFPERDVAWLDAADEGWRSTHTGTPSAWYQRRDAGSLYFGLNRPAQISTAETGELLIPYVVNPSSMTVSSNVPFNFAGVVRKDLQPYHQALVHYAAHDLEKLRKDPEASNQQLQKFLGYVQRYIAAVKPKGTKTLRQARSYFRDARGRGDLVGARAPWWR
jgi:hypothetical protein